MDAPDKDAAIRKFHRKVKTGCLTCKKRRVKCDERKPACQRCLSTGRFCDGYGIWGGGSGSVSSASGRAAIPVVSTPAAHTEFSADLGSLNFIRLSQVLGIAGKPEGIGFEFFRRYTIVKLPGLFDSYFWDSLVLQAGSQEPAVLHAITALGAAHRNEEQMALTEYNKAIGHLRRQLKRLDRDTRRIALITCMLFVCLELLRGGFKTGHTHLSNGLQLLQQIQKRDGHTPSNGAIVLQSNHQSVEDAIAEVFSRLNLQVALFGQMPPYCFQVGENLSTRLSYDVPSSFQTFCDARLHLDVLMNGAYTLTQQASGPATRQGVIPDIHYQRRNHLQSSLAEWLRAFDSSCMKMSLTANLRTMFGMPLLRLYHIMAKIMVATSLRGIDEMIYDSHLQDFSSLLGQAVGLWNSMREAVKKSHGSPMPRISFIADMGFIPPLYYSILKCRSPKLRRIAIDLLMSAPFREGPWDGPLVARMARYIIDMEEGSLYESIDISPSCDILDPSKAEPMDSLPIVPASNRINVVNLALPDSVGDKATLTCRRYQENGVWEANEVQFDVTFQNHRSSHFWYCGEDLYSK